MANVAPDPTAAAAVTLKSQFKIPEYSGRAKRSTFQGANGIRTELYSITDFIRQVQTIRKAASWKDEVTAEYVKLAFLPDSPVYDWYVNNLDETWMNSWDELAKKLEAQFATFVSVSDKVDILKSFKQRTSEESAHYYQRIVKGYNRFLEDMEREMSSSDLFKNETPPAKLQRQLVIRETTKFHIKNFFALGLHPELLADVTKSGKTSLEDIMNVAKQSEQASLQAAKRHTIAQVEDLAHPATSPEITEELLVAALKKFQGKFKPRSGPGKQPGRGAAPGKSTVTCHYCNNRGHYANECKKRIRDRTVNNVWRQNITDTPTSKEDWYRASQQKNAEVNTISVAEEELYSDYFSKN